MAIGLAFAFLAAAAAVFAFSYRRKMRDERAEDLQKLAAEMGLAYAKKDDFGLLHSLGEHSLFDRLNLFGVNRIENVLHGGVGLTDVYVFDFSYVVSTGKSSKRVEQTVFFAKNSAWSLPKFKLQPEGWWQKIRQKFGDRDIDFPESPDFSEQFWLKGPFETHVRAAFSPAVRAFFEENPPIWVEGENFHLLAWKPRRLQQPPEIRAFFEKNTALMQLLQGEQKAEFLDLAEIEKPAAQPLKNESNQTFS